MKINGVKYMRDFYPEDMQLRNWIENYWRQASKRAGFQEWDAPIMEYLDLYRRKSGDEIVSQLFLVSRTGGGEEMAIRPEMTPSLARLIAARQAALPRPIKWFCIARMCRAERGQRGRLREFWQWNADVLGLNDPIADAEIINVALDGLEAMGLTNQQVEVRVNSRGLMAALLRGVGVPEEKNGAVYAAIDKRGKMESPEAVTKIFEEIGLPTNTLTLLLELLDCDSLDRLDLFTRERNLTGHEAELARLRLVFEYLDCLGKAGYARFDIGIVRGLAYYTGPVFEIFDRAGKLRALCGGGRYDNLLSTMGGQVMPAVGFGMGDVVLGELLREVNRVPALAPAVDVYLIPLEDERIPDVLRLARQLRMRGQRADFATQAGNLGKALKRANAANIAQVILVGGNEWAAGNLRCRDMRTGLENDVPIANFF